LQFTDFLGQKSILQTALHNNTCCL